MCVLVRDELRERESHTSLGVGNWSIILPTAASADAGPLHSLQGVQGVVTMLTVVAKLGSAACLFFCFSTLYHIYLHTIILFHFKFTTAFYMLLT